MAEAKELVIPVKVDFQADLDRIHEATKKVQEAADKLHEFRHAMYELSDILSKMGMKMNDEEN